MALSEAKIGYVYIVDSLNLDRITMRRLEALGLTKGTQITILNRSRSGSVILKVRGSRFALGNKIAQAIDMKEEA